MKADLTTPLGKQICAKLDAALKKANWPAEKLFTREDLESFMASAARQSLENVIVWAQTGATADQIQEQLVVLISAKPAAPVANRG